MGPVSPLYDHFTDASSTFEAFLVVLEVLEVLLESPQAARVVTRPAATSGTATHFIRDMVTSGVGSGEFTVSYRFAWDREPRNNTMWWELHTGAARVRVAQAPSSAVMRPDVMASCIRAWSLTVRTASSLANNGICSDDLLTSRAVLAWIACTFGRS